jgi:hypothetical protein
VIGCVQTIAVRLARILQGLDAKAAAAAVSADGSVSATNVAQETQG